MQVRIYGWRRGDYQRRLRCGLARTKGACKSAGDRGYGERLGDEGNASRTGAVRGRRRSAPRGRAGGRGRRAEGRRVDGDGDHGDAPAAVLFAWESVMDTRGFWMKQLGEYQRRFWLFHLGHCILYALWLHRLAFCTWATRHIPLFTVPIPDSTSGTYTRQHTHRRCVIPLPISPQDYQLFAPPHL